MNRRNLLIVASAVLLLTASATRSDGCCGRRHKMRHMGTVACAAPQMPCAQAAPATYGCTQGEVRPFYVNGVCYWQICCNNTWRVTQYPCFANPPNCP